MTNSFESLNNPIFSALTTEHKALSQPAGCAIRYVKHVIPMAALSDGRSFSDLYKLLSPQEPIAFLTSKPLPFPSDWTIIKDIFIDQMVCADLKPLSLHPMVQLNRADVPAMMELTSITKPGPFLEDTIRMGRFFGIKSDDGRLLAMAGERLRMNGFTEVSAVCTNPDFQGRGYAGALITFVASLILSEGKVPFLHVKTDNIGAKKLYQKLGFVFRSEIRFTMLTI